MGEVLAAWLASLAVGAVGLPFCLAFLRRLPGAGAGFAFTAGLLAVSLPCFLLRVMSILPPGRGGSLLAFALAAVAASAVAGRLQERRAQLRPVLPGAILAASVFTWAFFVAAGFRSYNAEIAGTEQPMDLLFLNATLTSPEYPPRDPWLAGEPISYYYFGYVQLGTLGAIAGVPGSTAYNLGLAFTFAATVTGLVTLASALARWALPRARRRFVPAAAVAAIVLVLFVGSLSAVFEVAAAHERYSEPLYRAFGVEWLIPCAPGQSDNCYTGPTDPRTTAWYPTEYWFWWRGTRIIPGTITEFPFFSFLLGDLHPHLMALPLNLLALAFAAATWRGRSPLDAVSWRRPGLPLAIAAVFGALAFQNAWDVMTFSAVLAVAVFARNHRPLPLPRALLGTVGFLLPAAVLAAILYAPWWLTFSSQASGLYAYAGAGTRPAHAFLQFGTPVLTASLALLLLRRSRGGLEPAILSAGWLVVLPFLGWVALAALRGSLADAVDARGAGGWATLTILGGLTWALGTAAIALHLRRSPAAPVAGVATVGLLLLYGAELFLIRDVFYGSVPRLNTVFKLSYQAWLLLGLAGGVSLAAALANARRPALAIAAAPALLLIAAGLVYPATAAFNRTEGFSRTTDIDGLAWLQRADPDEYALVRWVAENTPPSAGIIEASGRRWALDGQGNRTMVNPNVDYTDAGRIASRTGRQVPIGWYFHEIQWRGDSEANRREFVARQDAVDDAYVSGSPERVVEVMREFGADYLVVGRLELDNYPGMLPDYDAFLDRVFESGNLRIYALPVYRQVSAR
ncbi:DUF2298 domain-containing protein [Tepidiforma sp.]|uniref:DUF2298 domain-containing protein n=1 Tax=Tepidiforma sp. TaxID=2682230 RepID=UPI002ADDB07D|nr:DUF2298 domain-containing protein [Tepidiforma sp.]